MATLEVEAESKTLPTAAGSSSTRMSSNVSYCPANEAPSRSSAVPEERTAKRSAPSPAAASNIWADISPKRSSAAGVTTKPGGTGKPTEARRARLAAFAPSSEVRRFVASEKVTTGGVGKPPASSVFTVSSSSRGHAWWRSIRCSGGYLLASLHVRRTQAEAEEAGGNREQPGALEKQEHEPRDGERAFTLGTQLPLATPLWPSDWKVWMTRIGTSRRRWTSARSRSRIGVPVASFLPSTLEATTASWMA